MLLIEIGLGLCNPFPVTGFLKAKESLFKLAFHYIVRISKPYIGKVFLAEEVRATLNPSLGINRATCSQDLDLFRYLGKSQFDDDCPLGERLRLNHSDLLPQRIAHSRWREVPERSGLHCFRCFQQTTVDSGLW